METLTLLTKARKAGLQIQLDGDTLTIRGPKSAERLASEVLSRKDEVVPIVQSQPYVSPPPPARPSRDLDPETLEMQFATTGRIRIESDWAGTVWLVASRSHVTGLEDGTVYEPDEIHFLVKLPPKERQQLHEFKRRFGGWIEGRRYDKWRKKVNANTTQHATAVQKLAMVIPAFVAKVNVPIISAKDAAGGTAAEVRSNTVCTRRFSATTSGTSLRE